MHQFVNVHDSVFAIIIIHYKVSSSDMLYTIKAAVEQSHIWLEIIENYHEVDISIPCLAEGTLS